MKKNLLTALFFSLGTAGVNAQAIPSDWSARFQAVMDSVTAVMSGQGIETGVSMAVNVPGIGRWEGVSGTADAETNTPLTTNTVLGIGSNSKLMTAVILLKLQEQGLLSLDDEIGDYLIDPIPNVDKTATIRQMLNHETGYFDYANDRVDDYYADILEDLNHFWTYAETASTLGEPHFPVGKAYRYSNTNYLLAAWIIEEVTGNTYAENLHQYITTPLGMTHTFEAGADTTALESVAQASTQFFGFWYYGLGSTALASMDRGAGSVTATPEDMVTFYDAVFNESFLSQESMEQLLTFDGAGQYGLGIQPYYSTALQQTVLRHGGVQLGYFSETIYDPTTRASIFIVTNNYDADFGAYTLAIKNVMKKNYPRKVDDAGISNIISPRTFQCLTAVTPVVNLTNYGTAPLTSATIRYRIDNFTVISHNWTGNLASGETMEVTLPASASTIGRHTLKAWTENPNGNSEGYTYNDSIAVPFGVKPNTVVPSVFSEDFENETTPILTWNPKNNGAYQWDITRITGLSGNHSMAKACGDNTLEGDESNADLPVIRLNAAPHELRFSYAYSHREAFLNTLQVLVSNDCGNTWDTLFDKSGAELSHGLITDPNDNYAVYFPMSEDEWHHEAISLGEYSGTDVHIRFRQIMNTIYGDNLYLDDISVQGTLGTPDLSQNDMRVFPNPASDNVTVSGLPENTTVTLYSISGNKLSETIVNGNTVIDLTAYAPGMYLLESPLGSARIVKK